MLSYKGACMKDMACAYATSRLKSSKHAETQSHCLELSQATQTGAYRVTWLPYHKKQSARHGSVHENAMSCQSIE